VFDKLLLDRAGVTVLGWGFQVGARSVYTKAPVKSVAELKGVKAGDAAKRIDQWLARFSLTGGDRDWGLAKVDELSRGMQQKVQFIATLLHDPELVILDEPFSGLDPINAQALKDAVLELRSRGKTVIFSTHVMENAERMCDSVCIIARGEKVHSDVGPRHVVDRRAGSLEELRGLLEVLRAVRLRGVRHHPVGAARVAKELDDGPRGRAERQLGRPGLDGDAVRGRRHGRSPSAGEEPLHGDLGVER